VSGSDTTRYTYDVLGNLLQVVLPSATTIDYLVDGQNRRIGRKVNGVVTQGLLYQGQLSPIAELNGSNQVVSRFVYGTRVNVPEYVIKSGTTYRVLTDHLGSVRLVVNTTTGAIAQRLDYDEYGRVTQNTSPGFQPFGYAGGLYDEATKLVRFGARDYDAETGRWTAKDPLGFGGGSSNLLAYAFEDPINLSDPEGLQAIPIWIPGTAVFPPPPLLFPESGWSDVADYYGPKIDQGIQELIYRARDLMCRAGKAIDIWFSKRNDLPSNGKPNSSSARDNGRGRGQIRDYGPDGRARTDYDFGHDHTGAGDPHAHDWDWTKSPPRQPPRPIRPGETPPRPE
jgi:RHS repeat-associated protein